MSIAQRNTYINIKAVTAKLWTSDKPIKTTITARQVARTLTALSDAGKQGISAIELSPHWAFRLGAYIHILRHNYDLNIETQREEHDGGWHGRYILHTPVEILERQEVR